MPRIGWGAGGSGLAGYCGSQDQTFYRLIVRTAGAKGDPLAPERLTFAGFWDTILPSVSVYRHDGA